MVLLYGIQLYMFQEEEENNFSLIYTLWTRWGFMDKSPISTIQALSLNGNSRKYMFN